MLRALDGCKAAVEACVPACWSYRLVSSSTELNELVGALQNDAASAADLAAAVR